MKKKKILLTIMEILAIILMVVSLCGILNQTNKEGPKEISYSEFLTMVDQNKVKEVSLDWDNNDFLFTCVDDESITYKTENPKYQDFKKDLLEKSVTVKEVDLSGKGSAIVNFLMSWIFPCIIFVVFFSFTTKLLNKKMGMDDVKFNFETKSEKKFSDVAGLKEVKQDLQTIVDMLKDPEKYKKAGARLSKGVLLYGPPGTGKTLLAKAIAGEAGIGFVAVSGSDFDDKYVGVGADRVGKLFKEAKEHAPCIIFIDEIDSIGAKRNSHDAAHARQTINKLLACMDGFDDSARVTVIAATNDLESIDSALNRPGRFDFRFAVGLPETVDERKEVISLYLKNKCIDETVNIDTLSKQTIGCSPALIEAILNDAAIISVNKNGIINYEMVDEAFYKQITEGHLKRDYQRDEDEMKLVAWHEAGHALAGYLLGMEITKVSIIPTTSGAGGHTMHNPKKMGMRSKTELLNNIIMTYGGRNAELLLNGESEITTGASQDIKQASDTIKHMVKHYGMSKFGMLNLDVLEINDKEVLLQEYQRISNETNERCYNLLKANINKLEFLANELIREETIDETGLKKIYEQFKDITEETECEK